MDAEAIDAVIKGRAAGDRFEECISLEPSWIPVDNDVLRLEEQNWNMLKESFALGLNFGLGNLPIMDIENSYPGNPYAERFIGHGWRFGQEIINLRG